MHKAERQQHYATNVEEILTLGARLRCPGQVSPSLPHSKHTPLCPFQLSCWEFKFSNSELRP